MLHDFRHSGEVSVTGLCRYPRIMAGEPHDRIEINPKADDVIAACLTYRKAGCITLSVRIDGTEVCVKILDIAEEEVGDDMVILFPVPAHACTPGTHFVQVTTSHVKTRFFGLVKEMETFSVSKPFELVIP